MTMVDGREAGEPGTESNVLLATPEIARRRVRQRLRRLRPYLIALLVAVLLVAGSWLLYFSSFLTVEKVEVTGNSALSSARIEKAAAVPFGKQVVRVDLEAVRARLEQIDAVASAEVTRSWPHTIAIRITERVPIAVVRTDGRERALSAEGIAFELKKSLLPEGIPVVETAVNVNAATLGEVARVVGSLPPAIAARVTLIKATSMDQIELDLRGAGGGVTVRWGSAEDSENKAKVLDILDDKDVRMIDVSVPGRPTTR